tara:strand:- start:470 stop:1414 length:945 start_codon:yes stop_codon:yes gene_type:complete
MTRTIYEFNTKNNNKSWNINAYKISSISGDDLFLEASSNNNIINIGNIVPVSSNIYDLGNTNSIIRNIYVNKVIGDISGDLYGNALTSTKLQKTIKIGGMDFDGRNDIMLPGVNIRGNQDTGGNAGSATRLKTSKKIGGIEFDGMYDIDLPGVNIPGNQNISGNAATATKLKTTKKIGGIEFNGMNDIDLPGVNIPGIQDISGNISGNAATATKLEKTIRIQGIPFDGTRSIWLPEIRPYAEKAAKLITDGSYANILLENDNIEYQGLSHNFVGDLSGSTISELREKIENLENENAVIKNKLNELLIQQGLTNI